MRLIGAVLLEQNAARQRQHRCLQLEALTEFLQPASEPEPIARPPKAA